MKSKLYLLFALLCASMMTWAATQYCGEALASTVGATTGQTVEFTASKTGELETTFSITSATSTIVGLYEAVLQNNGGGVLAGDWNNNSGWTLEGNTLSKVVAWTTYPTGNLQLHLIVRRDNSGGDSDIMGRTFTDIEVSAACGGGGDPLSDPALSLNETAVTLDATVPETFQIVPTQSGDGVVSYETSNVAIATVSSTGLVTAVGRGTATITVRTAETATYAADSETLTVTVNGPINWAALDWIGNGSGDAANDNKWKMAEHSYVNIQTPGFATEAGIYTTFDGAITYCSLESSQYTVSGAGMCLYLSAFTAEVTEVLVIDATHKQYIFYVYKDGASGTAYLNDIVPTNIYDTNFALETNGGWASATSGTAYLGNNGNDGDRWEGAASDPQIYTLDLGRRRIFNTVQIRWEGAYGKTFTIQVSNDAETWTTVKTVTDQVLDGFPYEQTLDFAEQTARYIRFNGTARGTGYGYSFWEFRVLLPGVSVLTSIDLSAASAISEVGGAGVALTAQPKDQNGKNMEAVVSWEITPASAGHMSGNTYIPDQIGAASIRAYNGEIHSPAVTVCGYEGSNLALSTNITTDNKVIAQSDPGSGGTDAFYAVDGNIGSVWQGSPTAGNVGDSRVYDSWFVIDLGAFYNIDLVALHFEGACSELYHIDFSENNSDWNLGYNLVGAEGINARNDYWTELDNNTKVRYVRFWSTKAATGYGMKMFEFEVYGTEWSSGDDEKPVMVSASLVSSTINSAVIAVSATDNDEVARYHVVDNVNGIDANFTPSAGQITIAGLTHNTTYNFTITAKDASNNESENSIVVPVTTPFDGSINLALNKSCEGGYYDNNPAESADKANDGLENTQWTTYGAHAIELDWWVVDLGRIYNLTNISVLWGDQYSPNYILQARVVAPTAADNADDAAWITLATVTDAVANAEKSTNVSGVGRYVRFRALARTDFLRLKEFRVYASGIADVDTEAPVMTSASLVSNTDSHATIAVAATDNVGIAKFHVVDAVNNIDAEFVADGGNITVTGLTGGTNYNFTITAIDFFGNESANSKSVPVTTTAHYTEPQAACPAPTWDATWVKAMYSPTYSANCGFDAWGSGSTFADDTYGKQCTVGNKYFGMVGFALNCLMMEKVHFDIWVADDMTIRFVPIWGGAEQGITKNLVGQEWNSIDIDLTEYTGVTDWGNITQFKLDEMQTNFNLWIANAYFYRTSAIVDNEAPTNVSASVTAQGFKSVKITAQAEDNSGAVNFKVMNGTTVMATGAAATATATEITIENLASGTNYNFNVVAYDEAGNEAEPVLVATATKFMPAPAPAPVFSGKNVIPVFTDAMSGAPAEIHSGGWGESTQYEWVDIASGDKVFYAQNFNWAGWHSWGADIDATNMMFLHVDVYSTGMTQFSVTPISHDPTREGSATINLTPNAWTSYDVPLSAYAANNIEWNKIFQFKFMNPVGGNEFMIDNVYLWQPVANTTPVMSGDAETGGWATFSCAEKVAVPAGVTAYKAVYEKTATEEVMNLTDIGNVIPAGEGVILKGAAGTAYAFSVTTEDAPTITDNALVGCPVRTDITSVLVDNDVFCLRYSELYSLTGFFLYTGQYVPAGKAYLALPKATPGAGSTTDRRLRFVINDSQVTTAITGAEAENAKITKFVENGQLFIRRGDTIYTIQGTRVK